MANYFFDEETDTSSRVTARRPLSRQQSARTNRHIDAMQYSTALRQIAADQDASLEQAQQARERSCQSARQSREERHEFRETQIEACRRRQQQLHDKKAAQYYAADARRSQDWHARKKADHEDHVEALSSDSYVRGCRAELKRRQIRSSERSWAAEHKQRNAQAMSVADENRLRMLQSIRDQRESENLKRAERTKGCFDAEERRKEQRYICSVSKEMQRTRGRITQLQAEKLAWELARRGEDAQQPELLIEEKLSNEAERMAELYGATQQHQQYQGAPFTPPAQRQRPRSAVTIRPRTGGIAAFSAEVPRSAASYDARGLGPRVCVVDARISVA